MVKIVKLKKSSKEKEPNALNDGMRTPDSSFETTIENRDFTVQ